MVDIAQLLAPEQLNALRDVISSAHQPDDAGADRPNKSVVTPQLRCREAAPHTATELLLHRIDKFVDDTIAASRLEEMTDSSHRIFVQEMHRIRGDLSAAKRAGNVPAELVELGLQAVSARKRLLDEFVPRDKNDPVPSVRPRTQIGTRRNGPSKIGAERPNTGSSKRTSQRDTSKIAGALVRRSMAESALARFDGETARVAKHLAEIATLSAAAYKKWITGQLRDIARFRVEISDRRLARAPEQRRRMHRAISSREHLLAALVQVRSRRILPTNAKALARRSDSATDWTHRQHPAQVGPLTQNYYLNPLHEK